MKIILKLRTFINDSIAIIVEILYLVVVRINLNIMYAFMTILIVMTTFDLAYDHTVIDSESTEIVHLDTEIESDVEVEVLVVNSTIGRGIITKDITLSVTAPIHSKYIQINTPPPEQS